MDGAPDHQVRGARRQGRGRRRDAFLVADIRSGRTAEQRSGLMLAIMRDVARIAGIVEASIWVYLCNLEPTDMVEYGHVLPLPGREKEWFDGLPSALRDYLVSLGTKKRDFAL